MILDENLFQNIVENSALSEAFDPSIPSWLRRALESSAIKSKFLIKNFDLENMKFVRIPREEFPTSGFAPIFKDENKQLVYLLRDRRNNHVYFPGINDDNIDVYIDEDDAMKSTPLKYLSRKQLLSLVVMMGYIDRTADDTFRSDTVTTRRDARKGMLYRGTGQYPHQYKVYDKDEAGNTDWDNYHYETEWNMTRGEDKSGYKIDSEKYKRMLDQANLQTYGRQLDRYAKKLEMVRDEIMSLMTKIDFKTYEGRWSNSLQSVVSKFEDALQEYRNLTQEIEHILNNENLTEDEKDKEIQSSFDGTNRWSYVASLRRKLEECWEYIKEYKVKVLKLDERFMFKNGTEMLAAGKRLRLNTLAEFEEFRAIADELGLETEDLDTFIRDEMLSEETGLDAIKRYKQELLDAGVELSQLVTEGVMSDLDIDVQNAGGVDAYVKNLQREIQELEFHIEWLKTDAAREAGRGGQFDSTTEVYEAIAEAEKDIKQLQTKIDIVKG